MLAGLAGGSVQGLLACRHGPDFDDQIDCSAGGGNWHGPFSWRRYLILLACKRRGTFGQGHGEMGAADDFLALLSLAECLAADLRLNYGLGVALNARIGRFVSPWVFFFQVASRRPLEAGRPGEGLGRGWLFAVRVI